jgi:hypothetical protein
MNSSMGPSPAMSAQNSLSGASTPITATSGVITTPGKGGNDTYQT